VRPPRRAHRWWAVPLATLGLLGIASIAVLGVLPATLVADKPIADPLDPSSIEDVTTPFARVPATAQAVSGRLRFDDPGGLAQRDVARPGEIYLVTVSEPAQSMLSYLVGRGEPAIELLTDVEKYGVATPTQRRAISLEMMATSEQIAQYVALRATGYDAQIVAGDVVVEQVLCLEAGETDCARWAPADEALDPGDRLLAVDGTTIDTVDDLIEELRDNQPGDRVALRIDRPEDGPRDVEVELIASPDEPQRALIGFIPFDTARVELPFEVDIDTGEIGGPSAGLAFTLTLIDDLSEGDLLGGRKIAVTGSIDREGNVGAIGGLPQKVSAVRQTGVEVFLVPASQGEETLARAREIAGDAVEIVPVATLDEALAALVELGGDPIAR